MSRKNVYENILATYKKDLDKGRELLYTNMAVLMRKNPLLKHPNHTYTPEDILSTAFLIADKLLLKNIPDNKKISRLWYLFNKGGGVLYNEINQYNCETYSIDETVENECRSYYMDDDMLEYVLVSNHVITPLESQLLKYLSEGRGKYEIARLMKTTYYNVRDMIDAMQKKIETFYKQNDIDADSC